jgi:TonB family protein
MIHRSIIILSGLLALSACATAAPGSATPEAEEQAQTAGGVRLLNASAAVSNIRTQYPQLLWDAGVTGAVVVDLTLDAAGRVASAQLRSSTHEMFSGPGRNVATGLHFTPPAAAGQTVRVRVKFEQPTGSVDLVNP